MRTLALILAVLLLTACGSTGIPVLEAEPGAEGVVFSVGVHNADSEHDDVEFSVRMFWEDGRELLVFDRVRLTEWRDAIDGEHHDNVNIATVVHANDLPQRIELVDYRRDRTKDAAIESDLPYQTLGFFLSPEGIGTSQRASNRPLDPNPWAH